MMKLYLSLVGYAGRSIRIEQENEMEKVVSLSDVISS
jgi:hypothetical protein